MRIPRLYVEQRLQTGAVITLPAERAHYVAQVLRLRAGDPLLVFSGDGQEFLATIDHRIRKHCSIRVQKLNRTEAAPGLYIRLWLGLSKGDRMDFALQKAVELGVTGFTPVLSARTVVRLGEERAGKRMRHWWGVMVSACEQSGRCRLVNLTNPTTLADLLPRRIGRGIVLDPAASCSLATRPPVDDSTTLLVGPEGGFTNDERDQAMAAGFDPVRLGKNILRTETAPIAAIAAIQALWGEFR